MPEVFFNGSEGRIEGKFIEGRDKKAPAALVLHPDPQYGGTMNNKVVYNLYKNLADQGFSVLRINFRGVGRSQGEFDHGMGELTDAATALDWLQTQVPYAEEYWACGFSFGSWIAMQLIMRRPDINRFIAVAPPVNKYDFSFLAPCPIPGFIAQGDQDSIVSTESVLEFIDKLGSKKTSNVDYKIIKNADHFFRGKIDEFNDAIADYVTHRHSIFADKNDDSQLEVNDEETNENNTRRQIMLDDFL